MSNIITTLSLLNHTFNIRDNTQLPPQPISKISTTHLIFDEVLLPPLTFFKVIYYPLRAYVAIIICKVDLFVEHTPGPTFSAFDKVTLHFPSLAFTLFQIHFTKKQMKQKEAKCCICDFKGQKLDFQPKFDFRCWILGVNFWLQCVDRFQS